MEHLPKGCRVIQVLNISRQWQVPIWFSISRTSSWRPGTVEYLPVCCIMVVQPSLLLFVLTYIYNQVALNVQVDFLKKEKEAWRQERIFQIEKIYVFFRIYYCWPSGCSSPFILWTVALSCFNLDLLTFLLSLITFSLLLSCCRYFMCNKLLFSGWIRVFIMEW